MLGFPTTPSQASPWLGSVSMRRKKVGELVLHFSVYLHPLVFTTISTFKGKWCGARKFEFMCVHGDSEKQNL